MKAEKSLTTRERLLASAESEFLHFGFRDASMRRIAGNADLTTGALYRLYQNKEALYSAVVGPYAQYIYDVFEKTTEDFFSLPAEEQKFRMLDFSKDACEKMLDFIYENFTKFKILLCSSQGTIYEHFLHHLADLEVDSTFVFMEGLKRQGFYIPELDRDLCHMLTSGMFGGMFETVVHDMKKEDAVRRVRQIRTFHTGGWEKLMGVNFSGNQDATKL